MIAQAVDNKRFAHLKILLEKEKAYYESIWNLTQEEAEKLRNRRPLTEITSLLKRKKVLVACIEELEQEVVPLRKLLQAHEVCPDVAELVSEINTLLGRTLDQDQQNQIMFKQQLALLRAKAESAK